MRHVLAAREGVRRGVPFLRRADGSRSSPPGSSSGEWRAPRPSPQGSRRCSARAMSGRLLLSTAPTSATRNSTPPNPRATTRPAASFPTMVRPPSLSTGSPGIGPVELPDSGAVDSKDAGRTAPDGAVAMTPDWTAQRMTDRTWRDRRRVGRSRRSGIGRLARRADRAAPREQLVHVERARGRKRRSAALATSS